MDKYEYKLKLDEIDALVAGGDYTTAAEIADTINWRKVKNINCLIKAGEVYSKKGRYDEAKDILLMAYDRSPIGRMIIYRLAELAIKMKNFAEAEEYYQEFVELAPHDNLKYVLRYKICKAKGSDIKTRIMILEELKEVEYSEEWGYELAYLYHQAGESGKCIDACDELILWFGDGVYVERALELKMLYQPLTKSQEDKYRTFKQGRDGVKEVYPYRTEAVRTMEIPAVSENIEKFNTTNLQEELAKSMQQILDATEKETVEDTMDNIKKMVEEIPYLQIQHTQDSQEQAPYIETDEEIDGSLQINFKEMLAEDQDGQYSLMVEGEAKEPQIHGQMSIEDVLSEWERTKRAAEAALLMAEKKKLESAKARALQEAGDIMDRLADVMPKLDAGVTPAQLLREEYLTEGNVSNEESAGRFMEGMNTMLQQEINRLQEEVKEEHELLQKIKRAKPNFDEQIGLKPYVPPQFEEPESEELQKEQEQWEEQSRDVFDEEEMTEEELDEEMQLAEAEFFGRTLENPESPLLKQDTKEIKTRQITEALDRQMEEFEQEQEETQAAETLAITNLTEKQKEIFSYFVQVDGMEKQICQALTGAAQRLAQKGNSATGNILIQGTEGSGKTVLATGIVKALQKEVATLNGKVGRIDAKALNTKDLSELLKKVAGGCLIIERAGEIDHETAVKLSLLLESDTSGLLVIMEDTRAGLNRALGQDDGFAKRFTEKITIPVFTSDELVGFAKKYANDLDYEIDNMGVLALYNRISSIQRLDRATTLAEVKEIIDEAIEKAERKSLKKAISIITSRRYTENDYVILREKDFEE